MSYRNKRPCLCPKQQMSIGAQAGDFLQRGALGMIKQWTGFGDYAISTNSLITGGAGGIGPQISQVSEREIRVKFREYIGDLTSSTTIGAFKSQAYAINPGLVDVFPWFASLATQYQQWKPNGMLVSFKTTSGEVTNTQSLGKVIIASDYNTTSMHTDFANAQEMLGESYAQESVPSQNMIHGLECAPSERARSLYFVRGGPVVTASMADFDLCQVTIATVGCPTASANLGSIYIDYDISMYKNSMFGGTQGKDTLTRVYGSYSTLTTTSPFGNTAIYHLAGTGTGGMGGASRDGVIYEDFYIDKINGRLIFPRWAKVGSCWIIGYYCNLNPTIANGSVVVIAQNLTTNLESQVPISAGAFLANATCWSLNTVTAESTPASQTWWKPQFSSIDGTANHSWRMFICCIPNTVGANVDVLLPSSLVVAFP